MLWQGHPCPWVKFALAQTAALEKLREPEDGGHPWKLAAIARVPAPVPTLAD